MSSAVTAIERLVSELGRGRKSDIAVLLDSVRDASRLATARYEIAKRKKDELEDCIRLLSAERLGIVSGPLSDTADPPYARLDLAREKSRLVAAQFLDSASKLEEASAQLANVASEIVAIIDKLEP